MGDSRLFLRAIHTTQSITFKNKKSSQVIHINNKSSEPKMILEDNFGVLSNTGYLSSLPARGWVLSTTRGALAGTQGELNHIIIGRINL